MTRLVGADIQEPGVAPTASASTSSHSRRGLKRLGQESSGTVLNRARVIVLGAVRCDDDGQTLGQHELRDRLGRGSGAAGHGVSQPALGRTAAGRALRGAHGVTTCRHCS